MNDKKIVKTDVLVVGAGVAGSTAALTLSKLGLKVMVLDHKDKGSLKFGECLPPKALVTLDALGLKQHFLEDDHISMQGYHVAWDDEGVYERNFITSPHGFGWLLNRKRFDEMLTNEAQKFGCKFLWKSKVTNFEDSENGWQVDVKGNEFIDKITTRALIDATGKSRSISRRLGAKTRRADNLISCISHLDHSKCEVQPTHDVLIENDTNGWWYSAPYSKDYSVITFFTDPDLPLPSTADDLLNLAQHLPHLGKRLQGAKLKDDSKLIKMPAYTSSLDKYSGKRWLAVGDAACSFDPLSSYGITSALGSGHYGGIALAEELAGKIGSTATYQSLIQKNFLEFLPIWKDEYQRASTHNSDFWKRRCI
jgi:flavin-dependent dehydrogenase